MSVASALVILGLAVPAWAQTPSAKPAVLWYRSTEGCPDLADFLTRVGDRASLVRAAQVGDRVDFVVNIALTPTGARGRLERETERGTVAIREVEDVRCDRVADVVALNLALALDPELDDAPPAPPAVAPAPDSGSSAEAPAAPGAAPPAPQRPVSMPQSPPRATIRVAPSPSTDDVAVRATEAREPLQWQVGLSGGVLGGVSPELLAAGSLFVERVAPLPLLPGLSVRAAVEAAFGSTDTQSGRVRQQLWGGRLEICPLQFWGGRFSLFPCAAGEAGRLQASRAYSASSLWAALGVHLRGRWSFAGRMALEGEVGATFPLTRYEVTAGSTVLYRSPAAGITAGLGVSIAF